MNILIVEDQDEKSEDIVQYLQKHYKDLHESHALNICIKQSLRGGLLELISAPNYGLIILDMSMPNFDPSIEDPLGGTPESFAGQEFLSQMKLRNISVPVVVLTQYAVFAKGQITLELLDKLFRLEHKSFYLGSVYYSSAGNSWQSELKELILGLGENG